MKQRLSALDGLRGMAALAVMISHLDHNLILAATGPIITAIFRTISAGPNAVQILFVLTGFLMAYLYPQIEKPLAFIQKRYTRIFPTFILAVVFFWLIGRFAQFSSLPVQVGLIMLLAISWRFVWKGIKHIDKTGILGRFIFYGFILLQGAVLSILLFVVPHILFNFPEGSLVQSITTLFANMTLVMPFSNYTPRLSPVFWSLTAEVIFYLFYPFFVLPLVHAAKKWGWVVGLIFILVTTKILFDIDREVMYQGGLLVVNFARASGFVSGVTIGTIYQSQGKLWNFLEKVFKKPFISFIVFIAFVFLQWGDSAIRDAGNVFASNYYFLFSSWIIALTVMSAITPGTSVQKFFSKKIFVFLGMISYTLYITHTQAIDWTLSLLSPLQNHIPLILYILILIPSATAVSVALAWVLYRSVDSLYFVYHKRIVLKKENVKSEIFPFVLPKFSFAWASLFFYVVIIIFIYAGRFSSALLIDRHFITIYQKPAFSKVSLLNGPIVIPFVATENNLSIVALHLEYFKKASETRDKNHNPSKIQFELLDRQNHMIFKSQSTAYLVEGTNEFQFGFPPISLSKNKYYSAKLTLIKGSKDDQVLVDTSPENFITLSIAPPGRIRFILLLINRIIFVIFTPSSFFAIAFALFVAVIMKTKKVVVKRVVSFPSLVLAHINNNGR